MGLGIRSKYAQMEISNGNRRKSETRKRSALAGYGFRRNYLGGMLPRICICCGEPMAPGGNVLSRNPNICASCSSILDGLEERQVIELEKPADEQSSPPEIHTRQAAEIGPSHPRLARLVK